MILLQTTVEFFILLLACSALTIYWRNSLTLVLNSSHLARFVMNYSHGIMVIALSGPYLIYSCYRSNSSPNLDGVDLPIHMHLLTDPILLLCMISCSHFLVDIPNCIKKKEPIFVLHHAVSSLTFAACFIYSVIDKNLTWWMSIYALLGEISNPLHQLFDAWVHLQRSISPTVSQLEKFYPIDCAFMFVFFVARFLLGPFHTYRLIYCEKNCPTLHISMILIFCFLVIEIGSFIWFYKMIKGLLKFRKTLATLKQKAA